MMPVRVGGDVDDVGKVEVELHDEGVSGIAGGDLYSDSKNRLDVWYFSIDWSISQSILIQKFWKNQFQKAIHLMIMLI